MIDLISSKFHTKFKILYINKNKKVPVFLQNYFYTYIFYTVNLHSDFKYTFIKEELHKRKKKLLF